MFVSNVSICGYRTKRALRDCPVSPDSMTPAGFTMMPQGWLQEVEKGYRGHCVLMVSPVFISFFFYSPSKMVLIIKFKDSSPKMEKRRKTIILKIIRKILE